jgi:hypothetical protein
LELTKLHFGSAGHHDVRQDFGTTHLTMIAGIQRPPSGGLFVCRVRICKMPRSIHNFAAEWLPALNRDTAAQQSLIRRSLSSCSSMLTRVFKKWNNLRAVATARELLSAYRRFKQVCRRVRFGDAKETRAIERELAVPELTRSTNIQVNG